VAALVYALCAATAGACAVLLLRGYRRSGARLLLWAALCFAFFTLNNLLVIVDLWLLPDVNLFLARTFAGLIGVSLLLYGLVWDSK
jgi:hypothetical protein